MKKLLFILPLLLGVIWQSCTEINDVVAAGDKPIIEAYLAPNSIVKMKVFSEIPYYENDSSFSQPIVGLSILITGDDGTSFPLQEVSNGYYESIEKLGSANTVYSMSFMHNGRTVSASTTIPPSPVDFAVDNLEIERLARDLSGGFIGGPPGGGGGFNQESQTPITITWSNPDNVYHFVAAQYLESTLDPIIVFPTNTEGFIRPPRQFNNEPIQGTANNLRPQQFEYFGTYAIILYRLNPDYALLYENGGTTSQNISTPVSTITNGLGIFTGVNADTLYLEIKRQL
ncbi:protein of unknown function [Spirosomataceae bacterium TFI 002]|nr:protein of unknown function [Spirosomataceae bacterium TFI 002]